MFTGFILTDTKVLASLIGTSQYRVSEVLSAYMNACTSSIQWQLIDVADKMYDNLDKSNWHTYASITNDYYYGLGLKNVYNCPLFILGGNDIIPMPIVSSPLMAYGAEYLYADMLYAFEFQEEKVWLEDCITKQPRFAVGRLPLTKDWDIEALEAYLEDCVTYMKTGIYVRGASMTTTQSWLRASQEMMRDIPTVVLDDANVPLNNRMVVSPDLDTTYEEMYRGYVTELKKIDFLVCNLHGCVEQNIPFFLGEYASHREFVVAIQPSMMQITTPAIFNTVACYGARYIGYETNESMLLSAMAYGTMLYCGACEASWGGTDMEGKSELMMKLYNIYLHKGMPAGMALMKAKQDYYRTCHNDDGDEYAMFTILEFNLFGCPILYMQPKLSEDYQPILLGHPVEEGQHAIKYQPKKMVPLYQSAYQVDNIYSYVRTLVDDNLSQIRAIVEREVYARLGLPAQNLQQIMRVSQGGYEMGYQFIYCWSPLSSYTDLRVYYVVNTNNSGTITKIICTK